MSKVFFTGDLHFGHENVLAFDHRPFETVEEMDVELIRRWNHKVSKGDLVYVLGDFIWKTRKEPLLEIISFSVRNGKGKKDLRPQRTKAKRI